MKLVTILTPCFNEEENIEKCYASVKHVFDTTLKSFNYEHLFIDNASSDRTVSILREICLSDPRVRVIINSRNFGPHNSPYYAMMQSSGDAVIPIMADLQTPVELIPTLINEWLKGVPLVMGVRQEMSESSLTRIKRGLFYKLISLTSPYPQVPHFIGFALYDRVIIEILRSLEAPAPYLRGLVSELGFRSVVVPYIQPIRNHGKSKQTNLGLFEYAILGVVSTTMSPIYLVCLLGVFLAATTPLTYLLMRILELLGLKSLPVDMTFFQACVVTLLSLNIAAVGLVGLYTGIALKHSRNIPLVIEKERFGGT